MKHKFLFLLESATLLIICVGVSVKAQHEDIPYQPVTNICETCVCLMRQDANRQLHQTLNCANQNFEHILPQWPKQFVEQTAVEIVVSYSGNNIRVLQMLPALPDPNSKLTLSCRHCGLQQLQAPLFIDVPNVEGLYLSWNELTADALKPDLFRGPFKSTKYEPIALKDLDLSHNRISTLDRKLFEHTPQLAKLNLAYNKLSVLDAPTAMALAGLTNLQRLDLSHNGLVSLPAELFAPTLRNLRSLDLSGNAFGVIPTGLAKLGKTLQQLNLAGNAMTSLSSQSFLGLTALRRLNISDVPTLRSLENGTFAGLYALEQLDCSHNPKLERLDFASLQQSSNLTQLDLSHNALMTLALNTNSSNSSKAVSWPRLRSFKIQGNPWFCSCELMVALEIAGSSPSGDARCDTPYILAGAKLSNLTAEQICNMVIPKKYQIVEDDTPRFLRRRYIILTAIIASIVVVLGLVIGFIVVCVRRRLKGDDYGVQPIRYTSVRGSNLSAFSQIQNGNTITSKFNAVTPATGAANA
ncbi:leucine-rich repeat-containing protein 70 [Scaptodrosophila lebanonensis]|uniref:Leucine-rich repeat-containing protein 70 n=1 Tax=Drosophila lebanonensis TaxID=7225 RepID=A0A6J2T103_DROLE|nr:leucine-rich repeat-containing protein 70 [Scaptodrosophila lebanonensis]